MGKLILYKAGSACQLATCKDSGNIISVAPFKAINGNEYSMLIGGTSSTYSSDAITNLKYLNGLTFVASADELSDFDNSDYTSNDISNLSYSRSIANTNYGRSYVIAVTNNNTSTVSIGSFKGEKTIKPTDSNVNKLSVNCLICGYFLDEPVTIEPGATKTFSINIDCYNNQL